MSSGGDVGRALELKLLDGIRYHQQNSRFVGRAYDTELSLLEALSIAEIEARPEIGIQELVPILQIDKSNVSRMISKLVKNEYIDANAHPSDKRRLVLKVGNRGHDFLLQRDRVIASTLGELLKNLSSIEQAELTRYLKILADGHHAPELKFRPAEHPVLVQFRRLSRAIGIYGDSFYGSAENNLTFHILSEIAYSVPPKKIGELAALLGVPLNSMSQILSRLETRGLLRRSTTSQDSRVRHLHLTKLGLEALESVERHAEKRISHAIQELSTERRAHFVDLLLRYVGRSQGAQQNTYILSEAVLVKPITTAEERQLARVFYILELVRAGRQNDITEMLFEAGDSAFILQKGDAYAGALSAAVAAGDLVIKQYALDEARITKNLEEDFLRIVFRTLSSAQAITHLAAREGSWAAETLLRMGAKLNPHQMVKLVMQA